MLIGILLTVVLAIFFPEFRGPSFVAWGLLIYWIPGWFIADFLDKRSEAAAKARELKALEEAKAIEADKTRLAALKAAAEETATKKRRARESMIITLGNISQTLGHLGELKRTNDGTYDAARPGAKREISDELLVITQVPEETLSYELGLVRSDTVVREYMRDVAEGLRFHAIDEPGAAVFLAAYDARSTVADATSKARSS